jgi:NAD+ kinase
MNRIGVLVHPTRPVQDALDVLQRWAQTHGLELVQVEDGQPSVAPAGQVRVSDLVVAIGGDGTVLRALHAAARTHTPVLGVAHGSLGALTTVAPSALGGALDRFARGDWAPRNLPALAVRPHSGRVAYAINDLVVFRRGGTQLRVELLVDDELYARVAGDGIVIATPLGSSAYSMAAGGPMLLADANAFVCTPLAMHGGNAPPLVVSARWEVKLNMTPGPSGFELEVDGKRLETPPTRVSLSTQRNYATLVSLDDSDLGITGLRRRGLIADSPRIVAENHEPD